MSQNASLDERRRRDWGRPIRSAQQPSREVHEAPRPSRRCSGLAGDPLGRPDPRLRLALLRQLGPGPSLGAATGRGRAEAAAAPTICATINAPAIDRDAGLVEALRLREATAAERLFATFGDRAYRLAMRITGNQEDAEEAVQDAFWSVARKIDTFRGDSAFGTWLYRIVSNAAYAKLRRRPRGRVVISLDDAEPAFREAGDDALSADGSSGLDDPVVQTELRAVLSSTVSELPPHYRAAIILHDVEGLSMAEVSEALGITVGTAKTRAHRGRLLLRKRLSTFMASAAPCAELTRSGRTTAVVERHWTGSSGQNVVIQGA